MKTKLLLILQRTHARYAAKPLMKTGGAHACLPCQVIDSKRLAKVVPQPPDGDCNLLGLTVRLCHACRMTLLSSSSKRNRISRLVIGASTGTANRGLQQPRQA